MPYHLSTRSCANLSGVHLDLVRVVHQAIVLTPVDFSVLEGVRLMARQRDLYAAGATWTMDSRHLTGHAVDLGAWVLGETRWDWPLYHKIAAAMFAAAQELEVDLVWGGNWAPPKADGPHFHLSRKSYPKEEADGQAD